MSINFTDGRGAAPSQGNPSPNKSTKPGQKIDPVQEQRKKQLLNQKKNIEKKLKKLVPITAALRNLAYRFAADPNKDPNRLYQQVRPFLQKIALSTGIVNNKTQIKPGITNKAGDTMYTVLLRRNTILVADNINRIKQQEENFASIEWSSQGIELNIWWPYITEEEEITPQTGKRAPGIPIR